MKCHDLFLLFCSFALYSGIDMNKESDGGSDEGNTYLIYDSKLIFITMCHE